MKRTLMAVLFTCILSVCVVISCGETWGAGKVKLTVQPGHGGDSSWWAEQIRIASDGNIDLVLYKPGQVVPDFEILDAVCSNPHQNEQCLFLW